MGSINNTTATPGTPPTYFDFTNLSTSNIAGATQNFSVLLGTGNSTRVGIYIDWNRDGTFNTTLGSEFMWSNTTFTANTTQTGSFTVPSVAPGVYRMRVGSEFGGMGIPPGPCSTNYGEYEDYLFVVRATSGTDAMAYMLTSPASFTTGNNSIALRWFNLGATTITNCTLAYQFNNGTPVTQTFTGSLAAGSGVVTSFTTALNIATTGTFPFRAYVSTASDANLSNDTLTRNILICNTMSGTYTIDSSQATSGTNFNNFNDAITALVCGGITAPVTINVLKGTYNEQVVIPPIPGSSAVNTVTFNGGSGNASNRILQFNFPGTPTNYAVLRLDGADNIRVRNITIASTSTNFGYGVLFNTSADNNIIDSCIIDLRAVTSTSTNNSAGINFSNSPTSLSGSGNNGAGNIISACQIIGSATGGAYRGINFYGNTSGTFTNGNQFLNNTITDFLESGIYVQYYANNTVIRGNTISRPNRTGSVGVFNGIYLWWYNQNTTIEGNRIHNPFGGSTTSTNTFYGINCSYNYFAGNVIRNNAIYNVNGMGTNYGIYDAYNYSTPVSLPIYFNTISLDNNTAKNNTTPDYGIYVIMGINDPSYIKQIRNNVISVTRDGSTSSAQRFGVYYQDNFRMVSDYNLIFTNATVGTNISVFQNGTSYASLAAWKSSNSAQFDQNSFSTNPLFVNIVSNPTPASCAVNNRGISIAGIITDITGATRGAVPDPGAFEFNAGGANDAGISALINPGGLYCSGSQSVVVRLKNYGTSNLTSASINWVVGTTSQTPFSWTGNLAPAAEANVTIGTFNFPSTPTAFTVFTSSPNNTTDVCAANDTMVLPPSQPGLTGVYTIDPLGSGSSNFVSFSSAVAALQQRGVCGPVTFNVAAGTYVEQVGILPIQGASSLNTVTFNGGTGNASTRILSFNNFNGYAGFDLNGADWITIKNITIRPNTGITANAIGVLFRNNADNNIIDSCIIDMGAITSTGSNSAGVAFSSSNFSTTSSGACGANNLIRGNSIKGSATGGAYYGVSIYTGSSSFSSANTNNRIIGNVIEDYYYAGVSLQWYTNDWTINQNTITRPNRTTSASTIYGIYDYYYNDNCTFSKNYIGNPFGGAPTSTNTFYAVYAYFSTSNAPKTITNNVIFNLNGNGTLYGIYSYYQYNARILYNSISSDNTASTGTSQSFAIRVEYTYGSQLPLVRNNVISLTRGGTGNQFGIFLFQGNGNIVTSNNNVVYRLAATAFTGHRNGTNYLTLANWQALGYDGSGSALNPQFTNPTNGNLRPTNTAVGNIGSATGLSGITSDDINGLPRNINTPDPGAYEWGPACTGSPTVYGAQVISTGTSICSGSSVNLRVNYDVVDNLTFQWQDSTGSGWSNVTSGLGATTYMYTTPGITSIVSYRCIVTCSTSTGNTTSSSVQVRNGLSGTYTINPAGSGASNFTSFAAANSVLSNFGACGPVTFNVANSTFNEQIVCTPVPGASATNTITFNGTSQTGSVITFGFPGVPTSYAVVELNGADFVTFKNLTITTTSNAYAYGFLLRNQADNNTIDNCIIDLSTITNTGSNNSAGINLSGSQVNTTTQGNHANNLTISNNSIIGGAAGGPYRGININASFNTPENANIRIVNNTITDFFESGLYLFYYCNNMLVSQNKISRPNRTTSTTLYGIYSYYPINRVIEKNTISNMFGGSPSNTNQMFAIADWYGFSNPGNTINNNLIISGNGNGTQYGIYNQSSYFGSIAHNTVVFNHATATPGAIYGLYTNGSTSSSFPFEVLNNIFNITSPGTGTSLRYGVYATTSNYVMKCNNNVYNLVAPSATNHIGYRGTNFTTFASWQGINYDQLGKNVDPIFTSVSDFTPTNIAVNNMGTGALNLLVTTDLTNKVRNSTSPDPGCIEWVPLCLGSAIAQGSPFQGTMRSGTVADFDHLKALDTVTFQITPPTGYTNSGFGSTWTIDNFSFRTTNLNAPATTDTATTVASGSTSGTLRFNPGVAYTDSTFVLTLRIKSITGQECESPFQRYVYVAPLPVPDFDTVGNCLGYPLTINNLSSILRGGMSYNWNFGDTTSNNTSTDFKPTYTFSRPGVFNVTLSVTSDLGYTTTRTKQVEISYEPQPNFSATAACTGDSIFFTNTTTIGGNQVPLTYSWDFGDNSTLSSAVNPSKLYSSIGVYNVKLNASTPGGCNKTIAKNVTVFPRPSAAFTTTNACFGDNTQFTNGSSVAYGNLGYEWFFGDGSTSTDANPMKKYSSASNFSVKLRVYTEYGCKDSLTQSVSVIAKPTASFSTANYCDNDSTVFTNSSSANGGPAVTYNWSFGDNSNSTNSASTFKHQYEDGSYTVVLNVTNGSCSDSKQVQLTIAEAPEASFVSPSVCQGNATQFDNTSNEGSGTTSYSWTFGNSGSSTLKHPSFTFPSSGTFNVWLKVTSGNCSDSVSSSVVVNTAPNAGFTMTPTSLLNQRQVNFTPSNTGYQSYLWSFGDGGSSQQVSPVYSYLNNGPFQVTLNVTDANGCVSTSTPQSISFNVSAGQVASKSFSFDVYPNPFRSNATIAYTLAKGGNIEVNLFDMTGKQIAVLHQGEENAGSYELNFSAADYNLASGTYFVRLSLNGEVQTKQIVQVK